MAMEQAVTKTSVAKASALPWQESGSVGLSDGGSAGVPGVTWEAQEKGGGGQSVSQSVERCEYA